MALSIVNSRVPTLSWKQKSLGNSSQLGKPYRVSPFPSSIFPTGSKPCNILQVKAQSSGDNIALSQVEIDKYSETWDHKPHNSFPPGFVFGASSSAFQVEGATKAEGKEPSMWDHFCEKFPGKIYGGASGEPGAASYYRYKEDVQQLVDIGLKAYRFSIAWSRVLPKGRGEPNAAGIAYYNKLIDELISKGIEPYVTLFHWDTPLALEDEYGGFLSRKIVEDYKNYVDLCFNKFGDRVKHWITMNEPMIFSTHGYSTGMHAPGHCTPDLEDYHCPVGDSIREPYKVAHNILLAHSEAVDLYRKKYKARQYGQIGITLVTEWLEPYDNTPLNKEAQQRALDFNFGWFMDPLKFGKYPFSMRALVRERLPIFTPEESAKLIDSFDFLGLNYYTATYVQDTPYNYTDQPKTILDDRSVKLNAFRGGLPIGPAEPNSTVYVYPRGIKKLILHIKERYNNPPIYITENGVNEYNKNRLKAEGFPVDNLPGPIDDIVRQEYHTAHLYEVEDAIRKKADVRGYFIWSLLDGFEWGDGYSSRMGVVFINYGESDLTRIPKNSSRWLTRFLNNIKQHKTLPVQAVKKEAQLVETVKNEAQYVETVKNEAQYVSATVSNH